MLTALDGCNNLTGQSAWAVTVHAILNTAARGSLLQHESQAQAL